TSELLVADIGGTNVRFAIAKIDEQHNIKLNRIEMYLTDNWLYLEDAINDYLAQVGKKVTKASIAFAGPVNSDEVSMTNGTWSFKQSSLASYLGMDEVRVLNDYYAKACSLPLLKSNQLLKVGRGIAEEGANKIVVGPGTGIGVGALVAVNGKWKAVASEGGHIAFSPSGDLEKEIGKIIADEYQRVSIEEVIAGRGMTNIYHALGIINGTNNDRLEPAEINRLATEENDPDSVQTLKIFSNMLGSYASDMAGTFNATGGVYLAGGVLPKIKEFFLESDFRAKFEENEKLPFVKDIETNLIIEEFPALIGAAGHYSGLFL
ncbi:MAG: glucokinase, partial [Emcibacteraceae bacterium]|nr:glucokinase [Emcibacteraceae bacterium]